MTFRVGQRVACVDANPYRYVSRDDDSYIASVDGLKTGGTYTIRQITISSFKGIAYLGIRLLEIERPFGDVAFDASRFRPLIERKSQISFTHGADPSSDQFDNRRLKVGASA